MNLQIRVFSRPSTAFSPSLNASNALAEDVHAVHVEVPRGLQHVAVVRVDLLEAMLFGAGQVESVTGSEEDRTRKVEDGFAGLFQQTRRHTKPLPPTARLIVLEVLQDRLHLAASHVVLPDVSLEDRGKLQPGQLARCKAVRVVGHSADSIGAWLVEVALGDVRRIEVNHRSSRSSDW
jgi:hypothetical protein